jgi:hypothetical protein
MRLTQKHVEAKVEILNSLLGFEDPQYLTVGSIRLDGAYGGWAIHRVMNDGGSVSSLSDFGTLREAERFLSGMIAALRLDPDIVRFVRCTLGNL